jgi:hypothetical protein
LLCPQMAEDPNVLAPVGSIILPVHQAPNLLLSLVKRWHLTQTSLQVLFSLFSYDNTAKLMKCNSADIVAGAFSIYPQSFKLLAYRIHNRMIL